MRRLTASDVMNPEVLTVRDDMTVGELAAFLVDNEISGAPVEDDDGRLVGVVSVTDVAAVASESGDIVPDRSNPDFFARGWEDSVNPEDLSSLHIEEGGTLVRDIMTRALYTVPDDTPISEVAEMMLDSHVHRLLVTRNGEVVGILSTSDLLGLLVEEDD